MEGSGERVLTAYPTHDHVGSITRDSGKNGGNDSTRPSRNGLVAGFRLGHCTRGALRMRRHARGLR